MKKILFSLATLSLISSIVFAENPTLLESNRADSKTNDFEAAVMESLTAIKKESPQVHEDSLRVWKNFDASRAKTINYTYRFWGRRLILWLKENKKIIFDSEAKVGEVFKVLWRKGLISQGAVIVLMVDTWSHLVYLEGSPDWEKRMENRTPEGGTAVSPPPSRRYEKSA